MDVRELLQRGYRFALALAHDPHAADDLVQEAWMGLLRAGGPRTASYLFACIRSRFIDGRRRVGVATERFDEQNEPLADEREWGPAIPALNGALQEALGRLRPEERAALYLAAVEGYSAQAIGDLFGWPRSTALSHMHRARGKLRDNPALGREWKS